MAGPFEVQGLQQTMQFFQQLPAALDAAGVAAVEAVDKDAAARAEKNAPIRTGALRKYIKPAVVQVRPGTILGGIGVFDGYRYPRKYNGGKSVMYVALRMHLHLMPHNTDAGYYNLGQKSSAQPSTPEGGVGGGFISRAVLQNAVAYSVMIQNAFQGFLVTVSKPYITNTPSNP